jgi:RHS repeat-associated protein
MITANGSASNPVVFTSSQALSGAGAPGQYKGITVSSGIGLSRFAYSDFYYGGDGSSPYAYGELSLSSGSTVEVEHSIFEHNLDSGVLAGAGTANVSYSTIANNGDGLSASGNGVLNLSNSVVTNNEVNGLHFNVSSGTLVGSTITANDITGNGRNGILISANCSNPLTSFPHGERNNIYANDESSTTTNGLELWMSGPGCRALHIDWKDNYWGPAGIDGGEELLCHGSLQYYPDPAEPGGWLAGPGKRSGDSALGWTPGPITTAGGEIHGGPKLPECLIFPEYESVYNSIYIGPAEFQTEYMPTHEPKHAPSPEPSELYGNSATGFDGGLEASPNLVKSHCADPVNCIIGNYSESFTDFTIPGFNAGLTFTRTYNSQAATSASATGPLGYGWSFSFGDSLLINGTAHTATVTGAQGNTVRFSESGEGSFSAPPWVQARLVRNGDGTYTYTLPDRRVEHFSSSGRLQSSEDREGNSTTLSYAEGRLSTVTDASARSLTLSYNGAGLIEKITDPAGHSVEYGYDESNDLVSVKNARGKITTFGYDGSHQLTSITDPRGGTLTNVYDSSHRVKEQIDALEHKSTWSYGEGDTKVTDPLGVVTDERYANNLPTQVTHAYGTSSASTTAYGYDARDDLAFVTDANGHSTAYSYDGEGNRAREVDALGDARKWTFNSTHEVLTATTPRAETTTIVRDSRGNAESVTRSVAGKSQTTEYTYTAQGKMASVTDPLKRTWRYEYDGQGDRVAEIDPEGDKATWTFDKDSHETSTVSPRGNAEGAEVARFTTRIERDPEGRPLEVVDPLGHTTNYAYDADGNLEALTDGNGHTTTYTHDADNELTRVKAANGSVTETGYDGDRRVVSQTDGNRHTTNLIRDPLGRVIEVLDPLNRPTTRQYDAAGNLTGITDAAKRTTTLSYDASDRMIEVSYSDGKTPTVSYEYDTDGNRVKMVDGTGTSTYAYDALDRLTESKDGHGDTAKYEYDLADELTKLTYPNGKAVTRAYDGAGRLQSVTDWLSHTTGFSYDPNSDVTKTAYPSGTGEEDLYAFNEADQLTAIEMKKGEEVQAGLSYGRDADGQLSSSKASGLPGEPSETAYSYDEASRLTKAGATAYEYDAANNPTKIGTSTNTYDAADELQSGSGATYTHDELGDRAAMTPASGPVTTYGYDQAGNLTSVSRSKEGETPAIEDSYAYDGNGLRASQTSSGTTNYLSWEASGGLPLLLNDSRYSYIYGPGGLPVEQIDGESHVLFLHHDQQGSTRLLSSTSGAVEGKASYDAYGNLIGSSGTASSPLGYDGQYTNADTGLIYLRARSYDPATAQFMSVDPLAAVTRSPYGYVGDSPLNGTDPAGLCEFLECAANFAAGAADTVTGGYSTKALDAIGIEPDTCSVAFKAGKIGGYAGVVIPWLGEEEAAARLWPSSAGEMDQLLGMEGRRISDGPATLGRNKVVWQPSQNTTITFEQHPYDQGAPAWHTGPHWHLDAPGVPPHERYLPGEAFPG